MDAGAYSRPQVCRLLGISGRQLRAWERQNLIHPQGTFSFRDLIALRTLLRLREHGVPSARIRQVLAAVREKLRDVRDPLGELKILVEGRTVAVRVGPSKLEPFTGQLLLDFDGSAAGQVLALPARLPDPNRPSGAGRRQEAKRWFERGLELEQSGAPYQEVIAAYRTAVELDPTSVGALVNLGTVYFHLKSWRQAEAYYKQALEVDPTYALAHFNLGNLYDELHDRPKALAHYLMAVKLNPRYADAHYNLALLYQSAGQILRAVRHWKAYLKLDSDSPWAAVARQELEKLRRAALVKGYESPDKGSGAGTVR